MDQSDVQLTRELERKAMASKICQIPGCAGEVRVFTSGEGRYSVECVKCGYSYDED